MKSLKRLMMLFVSSLILSGCSFSNTSKEDVSSKENENTSQKEEDFDAKDLYTYEIKNNRVKLLRYNGSYQECIYVPKIVEGYPVTSIAKGCYKHKKNRITRSEEDLDDVDGTYYIDDNIEEIEEGAFEDTSTFITSEEEEKEGWNDSAMNGSAKDEDEDGNVYYDTSRDDVFVHGGAVYVYERIVTGCFLARCLTQRKNVEVPREVEGHKVVDIGKKAFFRNEHIESVTLPDTIAYIYLYAFSECPNLKDVIFNSPNLSKIQPYAFSNCPSLSVVRLPENCTTVARCAFSNCGTIKEFYIPVSMVTFNESAFENTVVEKIYYAGTEAQWALVRKGDDSIYKDIEIIFCGEETTVELNNFRDLSKLYNGTNVHGKGILSTYARGNDGPGYQYICVTEESTGYTIILYYLSRYKDTPLDYIGREVEFTGMKTIYTGCVELGNPEFHFTEDKTIHKLTPMEFDLSGDREYQEANCYMLAHVQGKIVEQIGFKLAFENSTFYLYGQSDNHIDYVGKVVSTYGVVMPFNQELELAFDVRNLEIIEE